MLEPFFGLIACLAIYLGVWVFFRVGSEFQRDPSFERWCASQPMILAIRCRDAEDARFRLRQLVAPHDELVNLHGGVPWQYYRYDVRVQAVSETVVTIHIASAIPQRGPWTHRRDAAEVVEKLVAACGDAIDEVWMHGQLHPSEGRSSSRDHRGWLGRIGEEGGLEVTPMIGQPRWTLPPGSDEDGSALHPHAT
jgi:hypothetical protein